MRLLCRFVLPAIALIAAGSTACGLECELGLDLCPETVDAAEGEGDANVDEFVGPTSLCDADEACFVCGDDPAFDLVANGAGCDGQIVCEDIEFRVDCTLDPEGNEVCTCEIDRTVQLTFTPTDLCVAENSRARFLTACGWHFETD